MKEKTKKALRLDNPEAEGWRVQSYIERLESIAEEIELLNGYDNEIEEPDISQSRVQALKDRALLLLPVFDE